MENHNLPPFLIISYKPLFSDPEFPHCSATHYCTDNYVNEWLSLC